MKQNIAGFILPQMLKQLLMRVLMMMYWSKYRVRLYQK